jgi:hypothetical protein
MVRPLILIVLLLPLAAAALMQLPASTNVQAMSSPAGTNASAPFLFATRDGGLLMSWIERDAKDLKIAAVKVSRFQGGKWSAPSTVVRRNDLFVNWADFPSVVELADGTLFVHWLQQSGGGTYTYDVMLARSRDRGKSWSAPAVLHDDGKAAEHGFVSLVPHRTEPRVSAVWLDGRNMTAQGHDGGHGGQGDMSLRYASIDSAGRITNGAELDKRTCECCATAMTLTDDGPVIAYRDRDSNEVRDISVVRKTAKGWTPPRLLHNDGWKIAGCPVNGPQLDARGRNVAAAWFTTIGETPSVHVSFSSDAGASFSKPVKIDAGAPMGRVDLLLLDDGSAFVTWLDGAGDNAGIVARRVARDGKLGPMITVAKTTTARAAGFPRMARTGRDVVVAWTEQSAKQVKVARVTM